MVDLDHFKSVNDAYGHLCGDAVLQEAAKIMQACLCPYDGVGRYRGEEFLIIVPRSDAAAALGVAERIHKEIASKPIATPSGEVRVTASFGVTASAEATPVELQQLLQMADDALFRAKQNGRNRSELANVSSPLKVTPLASNSQ
jgi:diguanylate cyclase (GGDEF)-like protein